MVIMDTSRTLVLGAVWCHKGHMEPQCKVRTNLYARIDGALLTLRFFLPAPTHYDVLICLSSGVMVRYINHQSGMRLKVTTQKHGPGMASEALVTTAALTSGCNARKTPSMCRLVVSDEKGLVTPQSIYTCGFCRSD